MSESAQPKAKPISARQLTFTLMLALVLAALGCAATGVWILAGAGWMLVTLAVAFAGLVVLLARGMNAGG